MSLLHMLHILVVTVIMQNYNQTLTRLSTYFVQLHCTKVTKYRILYIYIIS